MTDFTPSPLQVQAIRDIREWFENRTDDQPVFRVWGYAGSGKSTLTKHAIAELGLDTMTRNPCVALFAGRWSGTCRARCRPKRSC